MNRKLFTVSLLLPASFVFAACARGEAPEATTDDPAGDVVVQEEGTTVHTNAVTEAPTGFDNKTNGFLTQADFDEARDIFEEREAIADGLGPVYNAQSCAECHQTPVTGAASQISEFRAGHFNGINFVDHPGGSLMNDRAIDASIQERIAAGQEVRTFRASLSVLGDGFVECVDSNTLVAISNAQPAAIRGTVIQVPVAEAGGAVRVGRFGWKNQNSSLRTFSGDAYVNEMGITSPEFPTENTSNGTSVAAFDTVPDPEDEDGADIDFFTNFMRATKAPPRDPATVNTATVQRGQQAFNAIGCVGCHTASITTVPAGTTINAGAFQCTTALGDKIIHPFSDFLLHNVGTGDGIVQNGGQGTRNQVRTAPLWGMRARDRLMHDLNTVSRTDAINRHAGQATTARNNFNALSAGSQQDVINFLNSL